MRRLLVLLLGLPSLALAQTTPAPATALPAFRSQVIVGTQQRRIGDSYRKTMDIIPKVTIEGVSRIAPLPAAEAIMMVVTMDTRAKYTTKQEVYNVLATETLPVPAVPNGERRQFTFAESTVSFDSYRDSSNVGGQVYKYYVYALRDPETKAIVDFQTNFTQLAAACKAHPEKREEILKLAKGARFPTGFGK
jgi:hypothetical protein